MEHEEWRDAPGFEGYYQVSNLGRVKSINRQVPHPRSKMITIKERIMKIQNSKQTGYPMVHFNVCGKFYLRSVHRLVAQAFIPNPENKPTVNHEDGNRQNNHIDNLSWATFSENQQHSYDKLNHTHVQRFGKEHPLAKAVYQYTLDGKFIAEHECTRLAGESAGVSQSAISGCCTGKGRCKNTGGFIWKYKSEVTEENLNGS